MEIQIPTPGRIVMYVPTTDDRAKYGCNSSKVLPAMVVATWEKSPNASVNLQVFNDGEQGTFWVTSAMADHSGSMAQRTWHWPPRA